MSDFYKISCIDQSKECNIIEPISENLKFKGSVNPITGALFNKEDIASAMKIFDSKCLNKNGKKQVCCDPQESNFRMSSEMRNNHKNTKYRVNREFGKIKSIDKCEDLTKCKGNEWESANPFILCKIGENQANIRDNVLRFETLNPTCYVQQCNNNEITFGDLISGSGKPNETRAYTDLKINDNIKDDNVAALKTFLDTYQQKNRKSGVDYVLTDNNNGDTLLLRAIEKNANKCVNLLLSRGADLNVRSSDKGMTPLHYAVMSGDMTIIASLINYGAKTNVFDFKGRPPLFYAIAYGTIENVIYLTNQNPSMLFVKDKNGNNALHITFMYSKYPDEISKYLIENGVEIDIKNNNGLLPNDIMNRRIKNIKEDELKINTEKFLEPFQTIGSAEDGDDTKEN